MRQVSQDRYMNSSKSNSYIWSLVGPALEGTPSMHSSWWEHRCACAGCRSVESHLFMEGGFVCEWQVATSSCSEGSPSVKHARIHGPVDTLQDLLKKIEGAAPAALNKLLNVFDRWYLARVFLTMSKNDNLWYLGHGFAGPVHSIDVLKGDDGIHRQAIVDHKDLPHGKRRFQLQNDPEI